MVVAVRERALACEFLSRASVVALHAVDVGSRAREGCVCVCVCVCVRGALTGCRAGEQVKKIIARMRAQQIVQKLESSIKHDDAFVKGVESKAEQAAAAH